MATNKLKAMEFKDVLVQPSNELVYFVTVIC